MGRLAGLLSIWLASVGSMGCAIATEAPALDSGGGPLVRCGATTIRTRAELEAARQCSVIDGDLKLATYGLERISADDLPHLERVTGSLLFVPAGAGQLREIALPALREIGTEGAEEPDVLEIGWDAGSLRRVSMPALRTVHGSVIIAALAALTELDFRELSVVDLAFGLGSLPALSKLRVGEDLSTGERVSFSGLCRLPSEDLPEVRPDSDVAPEIYGVGCCTHSAVECEFAACDC